MYECMLKHLVNAKLVTNINFVTFFRTEIGGM